MPSYITASDMKKRYDWKYLGDLCSDSTERVTPQAQLTNENMLSACQSASGKVDASLLYGDRYSSTDLSTLADNSLELLKEMCCTIALAILVKRKHAADVEKWKPHWDTAEEILEKLRTGGNVFNLPTVQAAATTQASGPSVIDYERSGLASHYPGMHYFPIERPTFNNG